MSPCATFYGTYSHLATGGPSIRRMLANSAPNAASNVLRMGVRATTTHRSARARPWKRDIAVIARSRVGPRGGCAIARKRWAPADPTVFRNHAAKGAADRGTGFTNAGASRRTVRIATALRDARSPKWRALTSDAAIGATELSLALALSAASTAIVPVAGGVCAGCTAGPTSATRALCSPCARGATSGLGSTGDWGTAGLQGSSSGFGSACVVRLTQGVGATRCVSTACSDAAAGTRCATAGTAACVDCASACVAAGTCAPAVATGHAKTAPAFETLIAGAVAVTGAALATSGAGTGSGARVGAAAAVGTAAGAGAHTTRAARASEVEQQCEADGRNETAHGFPSLRKASHGSAAFTSLAARQRLFRAARANKEEART